MSARHERASVSADVPPEIAREKRGRRGGRTLRTGLSYGTASYGYYGGMYYGGWVAPMTPPSESGSVLGPQFSGGGGAEGGGDSGASVGGAL